MKIASRRWAAPVATASCAVLATGCGLGTPNNSAAENEPMTVTSPAFHDNGQLPARYTCEGAASSPPLRWSPPPSNARSLALIVDDPDAAPGGYVHWVVFDIPPTVTELLEGQVPAGARQAHTTLGKPGYVAPCPPSGGTHHYRFTVYALNRVLNDPDNTLLKEAIKDIGAGVIAKGRLTGDFRR